MSMLQVNGKIRDTFRLLNENFLFLIVIESKVLKSVVHSSIVINCLLFNLLNVQVDLEKRFIMKNNINYAATILFRAVPKLIVVVGNGRHSNQLIVGDCIYLQFCKMKL